MPTTFDQINSTTSADEALRIYREENEAREDAARIERVTQIVSEEEDRRCCGWRPDEASCGNRLDPEEVELCAPCQSKEERFYNERRAQQERDEEYLSLHQQYAHLRYEQ